jgi:TolA-binding protein
MNENKVVNRTVAIALGLVCIVLAASLVVVLANGSNLDGSDNQQTIADLQAQLTNRTSTIATLNAQLASLQSQLNNINHNNTEYKEQIANLTQQIQEYLNILHLNKTAVLLNNKQLTQNPNASIVVWDDALNYAGYAKVTVQSSSNTTYVQAIYTCSGVNYNQTINVGTSGTAYFPVLPSTLRLIVGNIESTANVNATITATYYY